MGASRLDRGSPSGPPSRSVARRWALVAAYLAAITVGAIAVATPTGAQEADLTLDKTVGLDPSSCAAAVTDTVVIAPGDIVVYCYDMTNNTSTVTYTVHDLVDSELGTILADFPFVLAPGASVFLTQSAQIPSSVTNIATWTPSTGVITDTVVPALGAASVTVADLLILTATVGTDPSACATTDAITVTAGTDVTYCYFVRNTYPFSTLSWHDLHDSELGTILADFPFDLAPGASVFVTQTATITETFNNVITWTGRVFTDTAGVPAVDSAIAAVETTTTTTTTVADTTTTTTTVADTTTTTSADTTTTVADATTTVADTTTTVADATTTSTPAGLPPTGTLPATGGGGGSGMTWALVLLGLGGTLVLLGQRRNATRSDDH